MAALRYVYNRLPGYYNDHGNLTSRLNGWFSYQESLRGLNSLSGEGGGREIGFGSGARRVFGGNGPTRGYPSTVATTNIDEVRHQERQRVRRRAEDMPRDYAPRDRPGIDPEIEYRVARFLNQDGTTRTEVYWGNRFASGAEDARSLTVSAVRYDDRYRRVGTQTVSYRVTQPAERPRAADTKRHIALEGGGRPYHVAVQWDLHTSPDATTSNEASRRQVVRIDSLTALHSDASQLEMSDLQLMTIPGKAKGGGPQIDQAVPHPYDSVSVDKPILLYFEIYHLQKGADGRTEYTVTYESTQRTRKGFFGRLFGEDVDEEVTSASSEYAGSRRSTREYIQLDLGGRPDRKQETEVTVRVRDNVTGQQMERTVELTLVPGGAASS
jgi:hypothetical protein